MSNPETVHYSYEDIHNHTLRMIQKIEAQNYYGNPRRYDFIAAVSRGGLVAGVIASHQMGIPLKTIDWSTRDFKTQQSRMDIAQEIQSGATVLLVDDINDTGRTFLDLLHNWSYNPESRGRVVKATLFQRYTTKCPSDFYSQYIDNDNWIGFPWEKR